MELDPSNGCAILTRCQSMLGKAYAQLIWACLQRLVATAASGTTVQVQAGQKLL